MNSDKLCDITDKLYHLIYNHSFKYNHQEIPLHDFYMVMRVPTNHHVSRICTLKPWMRMKMMTGKVSII